MTKEQQDILDIHARAERAEARADRYEKALREITEEAAAYGNMVPLAVNVRRIAQEALRCE